MNPLLLLRPERLDLVIKTRMFLALMQGGDADAARVYRWHIQERTGGREPGGDKATVDEYVSACHALLASMVRGFDLGSPVVFGRNGRLMDGAHRIACGIAIGLDVAVSVIDIDGRASDWGEPWLRGHGINERDLQPILQSWESLQHEARCTRDAGCGRVASS